MGADSFSTYLKEEAREQAKVSGGTTNFMQTGNGRREALQTIKHFGGPGVWASDGDRT